jgi:carbamoyl-phosphate synthase large subunit
MNVMLTCAGRRNYLVQFFQQALRGRGEVFAGDACGQAPALRQADRSFILPPLSDAAYVDHLLALCRRNRVRLLISLNDLELPVLARHAARFFEIGTVPVISSPEVVEICSDKWATFKFLEASDLEAPETWLSLEDARAALASGETGFPLVVKPRWGTASIGIEYLEDDEELELGHALVRKRLPRTFLRDGIVIQKRLAGQEYGLDVVNDLDGRYQCTFVRRKLAMRAGETDRAVTVRSERLEAIGEVIGRRLGHIGVLDCDAIVKGDACCVIDMNPRFGGGYPFSHIAGANLPAALIAWANGEKPDASWLNVEPDVVASKYDELAVMENTR